MRWLWAATLGSLWASAGNWWATGFGALAGWLIGSMMEEPKPVLHAVSSKPQQWHSSPSRRWAGNRWVRLEGVDPMNKAGLEPGLLGEHARWWLELQQKHDRRKTRWWATEPLPPPISTMVFEDVEFEHEVAGWVLAVYAVWRCLR